MEESKAVAILSALAKGVNPSTGEVFPSNSAYQQPDVVRALYTALERFNAVPPSSAVAPPRSRAQLPSNVGKPWSEEEDQRLLEEFERGLTPAQLARELGRTLAGIEARLEKHGRLSAAERRTVNRFAGKSSAAS